MKQATLEISIDSLTKESSHQSPLEPPALARACLPTTFCRPRPQAERSHPRTISSSNQQRAILPTAYQIDAAGTHTHTRPWK